MKRVIDVDLIWREIDKYVYPYSEVGSRETIEDLKMQHLCLSIKNILDKYSRPIETYKTSFLLDNNFISHLSEEQQTDFKEHFTRQIYRKMGEHLCENQCGNIEVSELDRRTEQFTKTLELTVIKPQEKT